MICANNLQSI